MGGISSCVGPPAGPSPKGQGAQVLLRESRASSCAVQCFMVLIYGPEQGEHGEVARAAGARLSLS